jgi:hypothetical protein
MAIPDYFNPNTAIRDGTVGAVLSIARHGGSPQLNEKIPRSRVALPYSWQSLR